MIWHNLVHAVLICITPKTMQRIPVTSSTTFTKLVYIYGDAITDWFFIIILENNAKYGKRHSRLQVAFNANNFLK